jgi:chromosome segregation ATPase
MLAKFSRSTNLINCWEISRRLRFGKYSPIPLKMCDESNGATVEDTAVVTSTQKPQDETIVKQNEEDGRSTQGIKGLNVETAKNVAKLLNLMQINKKNEQDLKECVTNLDTKVNKAQQLEAANEDLKQQIMAKDAEIEALTKSIEEYKKLMANFEEKAKHIYDISMEISQIKQKKSAALLTFGKIQASSFKFYLTFVTFRLQTFVPTY